MSTESYDDRSESIDFDSEGTNESESDGVDACSARMNCTHASMSSPWHCTARST